MTIVTTALTLHRAIVGSTVLAVAVYLAGALRVAATASATSDEVPHIGAGVYYLRGDSRLNREHPPLTKVLAALALPHDDRLRPLPDRLPGTEIQWNVGRAYLFYGREPAESLLLKARAPLVVLNAFLIVALALAVRSIAGPLAACVAVWLPALCPLWIAHSSLVTTDATASTFYFSSAALAGWLLLAESRRSKLIAGGGLALMLAAGMAAKYSMLSALCFIPLGFAADAVRLRRWDRLRWIVPAAAGGGALGAGLAWGWPPDPGLYLFGVTQVGANHVNDGTYWSYAFGELYQGRNPLYFARALLVKVSLPVITLALLSPAFQFGRGRTPAPEATLTPWGCYVVPPLGYYLLMAFNAPAIGARYVMPVLPFLFVAAAYAGGCLLERARLRLLVVPLAIGHALSFAVALRTAPLAFFNGLVCRTSDLPPCLDDSNVDWGQSLSDLARYRNAHFPGVPLRLLYFGSSWPQYYMKDVSEADLIEMWAPRRALYAVSLHFTARLDDTAWPMKLKPLEVVAGTYAVYDLREQPEPNARK